MLVMLTISGVTVKGFCFFWVYLSNKTITLMKRLIFTGYACALLFCCPPAKAQQANTLHSLNQLLVNTVMTDLFTPPVASRIYAYPNLAFYECIRYNDPTLPSLSGKLNSWNAVMPPANGDKEEHFISGCFAFSYVAQTLVGSEYKFREWRENFSDSLRTVTDSAKLNRAIRYGRAVADSVIARTKIDNYAVTRGYPRFTYSHKKGKWQPTPEDYSNAVEPYFNQMMPFILRSPAQFAPKEKLLYDMNKQSVFYKTVNEIYFLCTHLDTVQKATAKYWDDNPNVSVNKGHLNYFIHKISPGGHWLMIAKEACIQDNASVERSSLAYSLTAMSLYDGFIACWDEKFKSNLVRPITVINYFIDKAWRPYIQTPPFPEFTSGHAVISNSAATVLTGLFGDHFEFTDYTEIPFGNESRHFSSFSAAAEESSLSRVYGGIHYPETCRISIAQGREIGSYVLSMIRSNPKP